MVYHVRKNYKKKESFSQDNVQVQQELQQIPPIQQHKPHVEMQNAPPKRLENVKFEAPMLRSEIKEQERTSTLNLIYIILILIVIMLIVGAFFYFKNKGSVSASSSSFYYF